MKTNKLSIIFAFIAILLLISACQKQTTQPNSGGIANTGDGDKGSGDMQAQDGRFVFSITDKAAEMGAVTKVEVTINSISAHSTTNGWVTLSDSQQTYDLLALKALGKAELAADTNATPGIYDQVNLDINKVAITDDKGVHDAKLPSSKLQVKGDFTLNAGQATAVSFDFAADESLHVTGKGEYILAPVVQVDSKTDADVDIGTDMFVRVSGGEHKTNMKVGMDESGNIGVGLTIPTDIEVSVGQDGKISLGKKLSAVAVNNLNLSGKGRLVVGITDPSADISSVSKIIITVDSISAHSEEYGWINLSDEQRSYDLLELDAEGKTSLAVDSYVAHDTYDQIRLDISEVKVTDSEGEHDAKLPSNELKIKQFYDVKSNETTVLSFGFDANSSLHKTGNGEYILAPVIHLVATEKANVSAGLDGALEIKGGKIRADTIVGMDIDGNIGVGKKIKDDQILKIDSSSKISVDMNI